MATRIDKTSTATKNVIAAFVICCALLLLPSSAAAQWSNLTLNMLDYPCRVLDTRIVDGPIQANEIFLFSVEEGFSSLQGGSSGCFVPTTAKAVKIMVKGQATTFPGYFRLFNADASVFGPFSSLQIAPGSYESGQFDVPIGGNMLVAIHSIVEAQAVVDIVGYYESAP